MMKRIFGTVVALAMLAGCGTKGSGKAATEARTVGAFSEVEVRGIVELDLTIGGAPAVELSGDDNLLSLVTTEIVGDELIISTSDGVRPDLPLVAHVTAPGPVTQIEGSGATEIRARDLTGSSLRVELSGAGEADLAGEVDEVDLRLSGAGSVDAEKLKAKKVEAEISGAGKVTLGEPEELVAEISGAGSIEHGGDPKIEKDISGAGSIRRR